MGTQILTTPYRVPSPRSVRGIGTDTYKLQLVKTYPVRVTSSSTNGVGRKRKATSVAREQRGIHVP